MATTQNTSPLVSRSQRVGYVLTDAGRQALAALSLDELAALRDALALGMTPDQLATSEWDGEPLFEVAVPAGLQPVLAEVTAERARQDARWGEQNHPNGTGAQYAERAEYERTRTNTAAADGTLTFRHVLAEEVAEAFAESDPVALRAELVQVAAVAAAWIEAIDRRAAAAAYAVTSARAAL